MNFVLINGVLLRASEWVDELASTHSEKAAKQAGHCLRLLSEKSESAACTADSDE